MLSVQLRDVERVGKPFQTMWLLPSRKSRAKGPHLNKVLLQFFLVLTLCSNVFSHHWPFKDCQASCPANLTSVLSPHTRHHKKAPPKGHLTTNTHEVSRRLTAVSSGHQSSSLSGPATCGCPCRHRPPRLSASPGNRCVPRTRPPAARRSNRPSSVFSVGAMLVSDDRSEHDRRVSFRSWKTWNLNSESP